MGLFKSDRLHKQNDSFQKALITEIITPFQLTMGRDNAYKS